MPTMEYEPHLPTYRAVLRGDDRAWAAWQAHPDLRSFALVETGLEIRYRELEKPGTFALGQLVKTLGADEALRLGQHVPPEFLLRHKHGDWGDLPEDDIRENAWSLENGAPLLRLSHPHRAETLGDSRVGPQRDDAPPPRGLLTPVAYCVDNNANFGYTMPSVTNIVLTPLMRWEVTCASMTP